MKLRDDKTESYIDALHRSRNNTAVNYAVDAGGNLQVGVLVAGRQDVVGIVGVAVLNLHGLRQGARCKKENKYGQDDCKPREVWRESWRKEQGVREAVA